MLGTRGVRLGVVKPGLYAMQVRALMEAAAERVAKGGKPGRRDHDPAHRHPRGAGEARRWVEERSPRPPVRVKKKPKVSIGTMIETPRAAVRADEIAEVADFFSFGTNDLTQMTFGFSRDDVEGG
jgi:pyruvate, orthophosphate dikinase